MGFLGDFFKGDWFKNNGGGLISSAIGAFSQMQTNKANAEIHASDNAFNAEQAQLNREFQADQAQNQMDFQRQMYEQYQSPEALVSQYQNAGLNPALMMTSGSHGAAGSFSGAAGDGSQASAASPIAMQNPIDTLALAQASKLNAESQNIQAGTKKTEAETGLVSQQSAKYNSYVDSIISSNKASFKQKMAAAFASTAEANWKTTLLPLEKQWYNAKLDLNKAEIALKNVQADVGEQQINDLQASIDMKRKQIEEIDAKIANLHYDNMLKAAQTQQASRSVLLMGAQMGLINAQTMEQNAFNIGLGGTARADLFKKQAYSAQGFGQQAREQAKTLEKLRNPQYRLLIMQGIESGVRSAGTVSSEVRSWMNPLSALKSTSQEYGSLQSNHEDLMQRYENVLEQLDQYNAAGFTGSMTF